MKKILLIVVSALFLFACTNNAKEVTTETNLDTTCVKQDTVMPVGVIDTSKTVDTTVTE